MPIGFAATPGSRNGYVVTQTRLPDELHRQLARAAEEACRSMNGKIIWRLRESLRSTESET
jgi:hypothetical protein